MVGRTQRALGIVALVALLSPWLTTAVVCVHILTDHDHEAERHEADLAASLHGHRHEVSTPGHDHVLTQPVARVVATEPLFLSFDACEELLSSKRGVVGSWSATGRLRLSGSGPPGHEGLSTVVLRI